MKCAGCLLGLFIYSQDARNRFLVNTPCTNTHTHTDSVCSRTCVWLSGWQSDSSICEYLSAAVDDTLTELSREQMVYQFKVKEGKIEIRASEKQTNKPLNDPFPLLKNVWKEDGAAEIYTHSSLGIILGKWNMGSGQIFYSFSDWWLEYCDSGNLQRYTLHFSPPAWLERGAVEQ